MAEHMKIHACQLQIKRSERNCAMKLREDVWIYKIGVKCRKFKWPLDSILKPRFLTSVQTFQKFVMSYTCAVPRG